MIQVRQNKCRRANLTNRSTRALCIIFVAFTLAGCSSFGASGPSTLAVEQSAASASTSLKVVKIEPIILERLDSTRAKKRFDDVFGDSSADPTIIGKGDIVDVTIWEAPPAVLFGNFNLETRNSMASAPAAGLQLPSQGVGNDGRISVPFIGPLDVAGRSLRDVERDIVAKLANKAHDPQAMVRLTQNEARSATLVGEFSGSRRMALTARGERLLDGIAAAGGTRQPVGKTTIQLTRGEKVASMPLDEIIRDPRQNVTLRPGDVVTALFQPFSFTALGASNLNAEVPFEATGMSLAQALGRIGGLRDERADIRGVFVFRFEDPAVLGLDAATNQGVSAKRIPVIYQINLADPAAMFYAQRFAMNDKDLVYISNAPLVDLQKFMGIVSSATFSIIGVSNALR